MIDHDYKNIGFYSSKGPYTLWGAVASFETLARSCCRTVHGRCFTMISLNQELMPIDSQRREFNNLGDREASGAWS